MEIKLQKWGNSFGIRIPKNILDSLNVKDNDYLSIEQIDDKIVISKSKNKKVSLKKLFENYKGVNLTSEFEWDGPRGNELW